jgi:hypothetical protein
MISPIGTTPKINTLPRFHKMTGSIYVTPVQAPDVVCFTGQSRPSDYKSVFDYLSAQILDSQAKKYGIDKSGLSASRIGDTLNKLDESGKIYQPVPMTVTDKIRWKSYIPTEIREGSVQKINEARVARMQEWNDFLENPAMLSETGRMRNPELVERIRGNNALKLVVWNAVISELKENNRHLPVPLDEKALLETIEGFEEIKEKDRSVRCASPSFLEMYTHRLRDNLLMDMGLSDHDSVWVKVPSIKHDPHNKDKNISTLEILSCKNWCTRSSVDKAEAALEDGDFHLFLKRGKNKLWEPLVGMAMAKGKIDQIQGVDNDNIIPNNLIEEIKTYIADNKIPCYYFMLDEGPKAGVAIKIGEKRGEINQTSKKSLIKAIKDKDNVSIFQSLNVPVTTLENGNLQIGTYKPSYNIDLKKGITVPYSALGINEDSLLQNVEIIDGNLILSNNKRAFNSSGITKFPPNLKVVTGKVVCSEEQFENFKDDILRVVDGKIKNCIVRTI